MKTSLSTKKSILSGSLATFAYAFVGLAFLSLSFMISPSVKAETVDSSVEELLNIILSDHPISGSVATTPTTTGSTSSGAVTETPTTTNTNTTGSATVVDTTTDTTTETTTPVTTTNTTTTGSSIHQDTEFTAALAWMYTKGLTQYNTVDGYMPLDGLTRQQAAKFFVVFADTVLAKKAPTTTTCAFTDTGFDATLQPYVLSACGLGIMYGKDGVFRPNDQISRSEFTAALVRMILGKRLDETTTPWWLSYYMQAREWTLTKETNANAFDGELSRYAAALLMYRAVGVVNANNQSTTDTTTDTTDTTTTTTTTGDNTTSSGGTSLTGTLINVPVVNSLLSDPALQEAVYWLHDIGVTRYTDINDYRPFDTLSRQEAAKMYVTFRYATVTKEAGSGSNECYFSDLTGADQSLVPYITQACNVGILKGSDGLFNPYGDLTRAQAIAILLRIVDGYQDESGPVWRQKYYDRALQLGMIGPTTPENFNKPISRYEVAMLLYKNKVQRDILGNLNNNFEKNKFIFMVSPTNAPTTGSITGLVSINISLLESAPNDSYVIDLFGAQYKIAKTVTQKYLNNDFVWYGKLLSLDETRELGTVAFTISNGVLIDGTVRPYQVSTMTYKITPSTQQPYYTLTRIDE